MGTMIIPIKYPIVMILETTVSSLIQSLMRSEIANGKNNPHIKANRDKNKSQRIGILV